MGKTETLSLLTTWYLIHIVKTSTRRTWDYFVNHEIRIPELTYIMESRRVFFVAHMNRFHKLNINMLNPSYPQFIVSVCGGRGLL